MNIHQSIQSQYLASLKMLRQAIEICPDAVWNAEKDQNRFWHIAYHAVFYTHLYMQPDGSVFVPWHKGRPETHFMGQVPWPPHHAPEPGAPYSRAELLEYADLVREQVLVVIPGLDLHAASGFDWLPLNKLELQFYNLRHLMLHTGELCERLWAGAGIESDWVGTQEVP